MKQIYFFILLNLYLILSANSQDIECFHTDPQARYRAHQVDFKAAKISVSFDTEEKQVFGQVEYVFQSKREQLDTLFLDAPNIEIKQVFLGSMPIEYTTNSEGLVIKFSKPLHWNFDYKLKIVYQTKPAKGLYFIGWDDPKNLLRKQIWTQGQGVDNRYWIPGFDDVADKLVTETLITFDSAYQVVSNGDLIETISNSNGTKTWHYKMTQPHVLYLIMIAIGKYSSYSTTSSSGVPIKQYYYPERAECVEPTYRYSAQMMDWQEQELGFPFPWSTYSNVPVQEFLYGAMENTTATIFTDYYYQDSRGYLDRSYVGVNCHEQTHQWFGDMITELSATHHWLHESFATHYAKHFRRKAFGEDEFNWIRREEMRSAWSADELNDIPIAHSQGGSSRHYAKGSLVIDMLRYVLGDESFKRAVTFYLKEHAYKSVDTNDFYRAFFECLGINLDWFFQQWVYRGSYPRYQIEKTEIKDTVSLVIKQTQKLTSTVSAFKMPITISYHYTDGTFDTLKFFNDSTYQVVNFIIPQSKTLQFVLFDKGYKIYKKVEFIKTYQELVDQAKHAPDMIDRYDAVFSLKSFSAEKKRADLLEIFKKEPFYAVRAEVIKQLNTDNNSLETMLLATQDSHHLVRRATIEDIETLNPKLKKQVVKMLNDSSYYNVELALEILCNSFPKEQKSFLQATKNQQGISHNVRIKWLEIAAKSDSVSYNELVDFSSSSYEFRTRVKSFQALERLGKPKDELYLNLLHAMLSFNSRLAGPAKNTLKAFISNQEERNKVLDLVKNSSVYSPESKKVLISQIVN